MRNLWVLYSKEMKSLFISPVAYMVLFLYSLVNGVLFSGWMDYMILTKAKGFTIFQMTLGNPFFWFILLIQAPVITMRTFSEEYKMGTIEMLLTAPVREWEIVLAKFFATMTFFVLLWVSLPLNLGFIVWFSTTANLFSWGMVGLPLAMLLLIGSLYVSVGLFTSSLSKNQIISAVFAFGIILLLFCIPIFGSIQSGSSLHDQLQYFSSAEHMGTASLGIFDSRPVVFYLSGTLFFLFLTQRVLEGRRLKS